MPTTAEPFPPRGENRYGCPEFMDVGPFRFECSGHVMELEDMAYIARRRQFRRGLITHTSWSPGQAGDCELIWYTEAPDGDD